MIHVTCRLTAKNRDQLLNPIRSVIDMGYIYLFTFDAQKDDSCAGRGRVAA